MYINIFKTSPDTNKSSFRTFSTIAGSLSHSMKYRGSTLPPSHKKPKKTVKLSTLIINTLEQPTGCRTEQLANQVAVVHALMKYKMNFAYLIQGEKHERTY